MSELNDKPISRDLSPQLISIMTTEHYVVWPCRRCHLCFQAEQKMEGKVDLLHVVFVSFYMACWKRGSVLLMEVGSQLRKSPGGKDGSPVPSSSVC